MPKNTEYLIHLIKNLATDNDHHHIVIEDLNLEDGFLSAWLKDIHGASEDAECLRMLLDLTVEQREDLVIMSEKTPAAVAAKGGLDRE